MLRRMLVGIDWGGTKIEGVAMSEEGDEVLRVREDTPRGDYRACLGVIAELVERLEREAGGPSERPIGVGIPGSLEPRSRLGKGASSTWMLRQPVEADLREVLGRDVIVENDADCFAASEARDGAGVLAMYAVHDRSANRVRREAGREEILGLLWELDAGQDDADGS